MTEETSLPEDRPVAVEEICQRLGLCRKTVYRAMNCAEIPALRVGKRWVVPREAFENFMAVNRQQRVD